MNVIFNATEEDNFNLFANHTNLLIFGSNEFELTKKATLCMISMCKWFLTNKLSLSVKKTCYTALLAELFSYFRMLSDKCKLTPVKTCKYLAVFIDDNLKISNIKNLAVYT